MNPNNTKELRLIEYALHFLLANADDDNAEDLAIDGIDENFVMAYSRKIETQIQDHKATLSYK
jgi:hypothetical protein